MSVCFADGMLGEDMFSIGTLSVAIGNKLVLWQLLLDREFLPSSFSVVPPNLVGTPQSERIFDFSKIEHWTIPWTIPWRIDLLSLSCFPHSSE